MGAEVKVIDASALAALLFSEPRADEVAKRLGDASLVAPTLLDYEVASVCLKKIRRYPRQRAGLLEALRLIERADLRRVVVPVPEVIPLARRRRLTVYDAAYLWLAHTLDAELVTLDEKLLRAARGGR